ncbi:MAG: serine/threonine protein kinase [Myxococcota bacterium]|nr:serine/threonine protein kinase [Myxococcota bacterium]MDW8361752.1 protein kinase [Myxococcales bacterium]
MRRHVGPYVLEQRLATGGMAEVFVARRPGPHGFRKRVALKRILPQYARDPDFVAMFVDEARICAQLDHPNLVQVFDFGEADGELYIAMEYVDGSSVNRLLRAVAARGEAVPEEVVLHVGSQCAHALDHVHRAVDEQGRPLGLVHRDVSPANVLLSRTGHVKLADFGIALSSGKRARTDEGHVRGKLGYMSPEQVVGRALDGRSDVFTLCTVLAEMLLAEPLFGTGNDVDVLVRIRDADVSRLNRALRRVPRDVVEVVRTGLARRPEDRPTARELAVAIDSVRRRRGLVRGPERTAALLQRLELVTPSPADRGAVEAGARPTTLLDPVGLASETLPQVVDLSAPAPQLYEIAGRAGSVSFPELVRLITLGAVGPQTPVRRHGGEARPAAELPELVRIVCSPGRTWPGDVLVRSERRGVLDGASLVHVVHRLCTEGATGALYLFDGDRRKKIYFVEGRPEFVTSTDPSELLGEFLVTTGRCLRMEVDMGLAVMSRHGGRLGDALVALGILRPAELYAAIWEQVRARYLEAFRWDRGQWAFVGGERSGEEVLPGTHDPRELLRDAARESDVARLAARHAALENRRLLGNPRAPVPLALYRVPPAWTRVLSVPLEGTTVGAVLDSERRRGPRSLDEAHRALHLGLSCELLLAA